MGPLLYCVDVINIAVNMLLVTISPLEYTLKLRVNFAIFLLNRFNLNDISVQGVFSFI